MILSYLAQLRSFFLPNSLHGYYIASQKLVGLEIQSTTIFATTVSVYGHKKVISGCYQQEISQDDLTPLDERIVDALKKIALVIGDYNELTLSLSNNLTIFKEITVPFIDMDTIKMVIPFEVEPMLPFALNEAFIDALIVHQDKVAHKTTLQVAAIKKSTVATYVALLNKAGLTPTKFSVHLFEFYSIYKEIPEYHNDMTSTLCIETMSDSRQFIAIVDGELANVRIIPRGSTDARFIQDIQFTLDTFNNQLPESKKIKRILVATSSIQSKELINEIQEATDLKTEEFLLYKVVHNNTIKAINSVLLTTPYIAAMGAGLDLPYTRSINFLKDEFEIHDDRLFVKQIITAATIAIISFGALIFHTQHIQNKLKKEINISQQDAKTRLIKELNLPASQSKNSLKSVINFANNFITKQEEIWFALSNQNRYSFLHFLQELFRRLDPQALGLSLRLLTINDATSTMTLEGEVKGFNELEKFTEELNRPNSIFTLVKAPQEPKFSITLTLNKNYKED